MIDLIFIDQILSIVVLDKHCIYLLLVSNISHIVEYLSDDFSCFVEYFCTQLYSTALWDINKKLHGNHITRDALYFFLIFFLLYIRRKLEENKTWSLVSNSS